MNDHKPKAIVLITTDEQRQDTLGIYGCEAIQTPHIDRIGEQGTCFDNAYVVSPWCLPSRCSMLTGCYPHTHGAYSNFSNGLLKHDQPNLYKSAREAGYHTAHFGKCHYEPVRYGMFSADETAISPETRDYYLSLGIDHLELQDDKNVSIWQYDDYSRALDEAGFLSDYRKEAWNKNSGGVFTFPGPKEWHPDCWVGEKAKTYVDEWNQDNDLFMWVSFSGPHYPIDPPEEYLDRVDMDKLPPMVFKEGEWTDEQRIHYGSFHGGGGIDGCGYSERNACGDYDDAYWKRMRQHYMANMALIDDQVGAVVKSLEEKFGENVLIVFTADHGDMLGNHRLWGKNNCGYDEVLKIPFLMRKPGDDGRNGRVSERIQSIDIFPTLRAAMDLPPVPVDGAIIENVVQRGGYEYTLAEGENFYCISDGRYKLIRVRIPSREDSVYELYDLENDPMCYENRYSDLESQRIIDRLQSAVLNDEIVDTLFGQSH